ncbi:hypothetical protein [Rossellomorea vietnamensis]|nr:hypothetical protein [Rossellomorea vietnamensis]MCC5801785.1 hypothetical protein [Rossellomorea vietnamensis]
MATANKVDKLKFMDEIKNIIRLNMENKEMTASEARKSLGNKRYEK